MNFKKKKEKAIEGSSNGSNKIEQTESNEEISQEIEGNNLENNFNNPPSFDSNSDHQSVEDNIIQQEKSECLNDNSEEINDIIQQKFKLLGKNLFDTPIENHEKKKSKESIRRNEYAYYPQENHQPFLQSQQQYYQIPYQPVTYFPLNGYYYPQPFMIYQPQMNHNLNPSKMNQSHEMSSITEKPGVDEEDIMELKVKNMNLESENIALKDKIAQMLKKLKHKDKNDKKISEEKQAKENSLIESLSEENSKFKLQLKVEEKKNIDLQEENDRLILRKKQDKKEIGSLNEKLSKLENECDSLFEEKCLCEKKIKDLERKNEILNITIKDMKSDYENLNNKFYILKKENEKLKNSIEDSNEQNYFFKTKNEKIHTKVFKKDTDNEEARIRKEIFDCQNIVRKLTTSKKDLENELFKIPQFSKTPKEKKRELELEKELEILEKQINTNKLKIRQLNNQLFE